MIRQLARVMSGLAICVTVSCSFPYAFRDYPIEVYRPARVSLSGSGLYAGIIYRNPVVPQEISRFDSYFSHTDLAPPLYHINPVAYHHIEMVKEILNKSGYFGSAEYLGEEIIPAGDSIQIKPVSPDEARFYFERNPEKDVLFFLDYLAGTIYTEYYRDISFFRRILLTNPVWQISERSTGRVFMYNRADTVLWEGFAKSANDISKLVPEQEQGFLEGAETSAETFSHFLIPQWILVNRTIYKSFNDDMRLAYKLTTQNRWTEAASVYERISESGNKKMKAMAMYNLALICEMQDDLEGATNWLLNSYFVFEESKPEHARLTKEYLGIIAQRKKDMNILESVQIQDFQ